MTKWNKKEDENMLALEQLKLEMQPYRAKIIEMGNSL